MIQTACIYLDSTMWARLNVIQLMCSPKSLTRFPSTIRSYLATRHRLADHRSSVIVITAHPYIVFLPKTRLGSSQASGFGIIGNHFENTFSGSYCALRRCRRLELVPNNTRCCESPGTWPPLTRF